MKNDMNRLSPPAPFEDATPLLNDPPTLRHQAERDGFLFFRALLPPEPLIDLRQRMLQVVADHGWIAPGTNLLEGWIDRDAINQVPAEEMRLDVGVSKAAYDAVQKLEAFHRMPHHPKLLQVYRLLFDAQVLPHPRHIARMISPHQAMTPTPAHQDFIHIQGTTNTWTAWFPLHDCPRSRGPLVALRGSHRHGMIEVKPASGAGGVGVQLCPGETDWVGGDYALGDVLTFNSFTVHRALKSDGGNQMRLSLDVRYQPADQEVEPHSLLPHCELSWEQIYAGWEKDDLKYYWKRFPLKLSQWDEMIRWQKERICS
jgi:hypothetical protein